MGVYPSRMERENINNLSPQCPVSSGPRLFFPYGRAWWQNARTIYIYDLNVLRLSAALITCRAFRQGIADGLD